MNLLKSNILKCPRCNVDSRLTHYKNGVIALDHGCLCLRKCIDDSVNDNLPDAPVWLSMVLPAVSVETMYFLMPKKEEKGREL